ncbi:MAG: nucleoside recognition protein [Bacteroidales bacterium]|nr:nucleoside recognition protein [Bacteroidales bacterium]
MKLATIKNRSITAIKAAIRPGLKTAWWMSKITVAVSLIMNILQYLGAIDVIAQWLNPVFHLFGLPGEAALVFISGYFVNIYSAVAAAVTLNIDVRSITILAVMCLCAHNMIVETAIQKKTGSSALRMVLVRTISAIVSAFILNWLLPIHSSTISTSVQSIATKPLFSEFAWQWIIVTLKLLLKMFVLIMTLNILQKLLVEFGVIHWLSKMLRPILIVFGLPESTSFLWIVANILGLAYGSAVMLEEVNEGRISKEDADLLNHHIGIAHSNLEDVTLFFSIGASLWWMLFLRWGLAAVIVWVRKWILQVKKIEYQ